jgi:hypothetical protein
VRYAIAELEAHPLLLREELDLERDQEENENNEPAHWGHGDRHAKETGQNAGEDGWPTPAYEPVVTSSWACFMVNGARSNCCRGARPDGKQQAGGVAHDFNNLLAVMVGNASLAVESCSIGGRERKFLDEVIRSGMKAADLTSQLLAYAGKGTRRAWEAAVTAARRTSRTKPRGVPRPDTFRITRRLTK